ncbi:hypothetical protein QFC20_001835 [Naganishia adeliensis]|uniref:Uncharacterized protein n=1 Tax=Naganishia adeliensis TaxID=92952 RepID=A0ACC2WTE8_9TREE|nr:hypothetical protein QFC20_001835 [Naganishia adeliensis]
MVPERSSSFARSPPIYPDIAPSNHNPGPYYTQRPVQQYDEFEPQLPIQETMYDVAGAAAGTTALPEVFTSTLSREIPWFGPETFTDVSTMDAAPFWPSTGVVANVGYQQSSYARSTDEMSYAAQFSVPSLEATNLTEQDPPMYVLRDRRRGRTGRSHQ